MMDEVTKGLIETLKNVAEWIQGLPIPTTGATAKLKKIDAAIARAEAALSAPQQDDRKDSDRLDAIESMVRASSTGVSFDWCRHVEDGYIAEKGYRMMWRRALGPREPDIRQAIDAAMGWKRPQGELE